MDVIQFTAVQCFTFTCRTHNQIRDKINKCICVQPHWQLNKTMVVIMVIMYK